MRAQFDTIGSSYHGTLQNTAVLPLITMDVPQRPALQRTRRYTNCFLDFHGARMPTGYGAGSASVNGQ